MKRILLVVLLLLAIPALTWADSVSINASPGTIPVAGTSTVTVNYTPGANLLSAYQFTLTYDPSIVSYGGVTFGAGLGGDPFGQSVLFSSGSLDIAEVNLFSDLSNLQNSGQPFTLFSVAFTGIAPGNSPVVLTPIQLIDGQTIPSDITTAVNMVGTNVNVTSNNATPEPATLLLLGSGLPLLLRRRRKAR